MSTKSGPRTSCVVGIDLAGSPKRDTGVCRILNLQHLTTTVLHSDLEILEFVREARPALVVVDAPLSLPRGRRTIDDRSGPHFRECDRELLRRKVPFFPITLGPMRMLTARGMTLAEKLSRSGLPGLEGYPGGSQDLLGLPRKKAGLELLQRRLRSRGLRGDLARRTLTGDELDAVTIAWVGWNYQRGKGVLIGDPAEGLMLLPEPRSGRAVGRPIRRNVVPSGTGRKAQPRVAS